jgi:hypothetical protein
MKKVNQHPTKKQPILFSPKVKRKHEQTSRKDDAAGSLGRKETDMRFSFTNWTLASI